MTRTESMTGDNWTERRRWPRVPCSSHVLVAAPTIVGTFAARDIGGGGAFLRSPIIPEVGTPLWVEFDLGKNQHFAMMATVIRAQHGIPGNDDCGFAIRFDVEEAIAEQVSAALSRSA